MNKPSKIRHIATLERVSPTWRARVEQALDYWLPEAQTHPARLHQAMRYSALSGGKRLRPILVFATGQALGATPALLDGPACAVECIHAYSLIHDDLPAMDDDELRRGQPTCHKAFDEATAILAGDALQTLAFHILAHDPAGVQNSRARLRMVEVLALAAGSRGMAGGQAIDLAATGQQLDVAQLEDMHIHKTGALIRASVQLGALAASPVDEELLQRLDHYGKCIGLAFQIRDDILDVEGETEALGKARGSDQRQAKATYPALLGMREARETADRLVEDALESLEGLDQSADVLRGIAEYCIGRNH
ncbi:(2E,6E)-farnesyl diphosphate synthase [Alkalilimnicola ehrlichii]|uniref:(2E,6E)-farnesyl diphosphate synthase n=1 Tax=Alkalilimnicola ehrlichii TaxID=351052 RepID=UPI003B9E13CA